LGQWKKEKVANKECARRLGRDIRTVQRELQRNNIRVTTGRNDWEIIYEPKHAQYVANQRKYKAYDAKVPLKNKWVYSYVMDHLKDGWSPEQIAGRLRLEHPGKRKWHICHETIYQFIYREKTDRTKAAMRQESILNRHYEGQEKEQITVTDYQKPLWEYLRRKQVRRRKRSGRRVRRVNIPDRVSIHERPMVVDRRKQFGHWEGDSIVGLNHMSGLHTEYERVSSLTRFERMQRISSDAFVVATRKIFGQLPSVARRSATFDNGSEHTKHRELTRRYGMQTYFADPYASWQRGGNENANLWIRYYFPKGTDFSTISDEELKDVEWELNNRPRKRLKFRTPQEVFSEYLNQA
jgi:IS30 family transposase